MTLTFEFSLFCMTSAYCLHNLIIQSCMYGSLKAMFKSRTGVDIGSFPSFKSSRVLCYDRRSVGQSIMEKKAPIWGLRPHFITVRQWRVCWCGALILTRGRICRLQLLLVLASKVIFGSESRWTLDLRLLPQIRDFLFVPSSDSQGYGGGIRPRLHTGVPIFRAAFSLYKLGMDPIENNFSSSSSLLRNVFVAAETRLSAISQQRPSVLSPLSWSFNFYAKIYILYEIISLIVRVHIA
jgi:hypothetical protein